MVTKHDEKQQKGSALSTHNGVVPVVIQQFKPFPFHLSSISRGRVMHWATHVPLALLRTNPNIFLCPSGRACGGWGWLRLLTGQAACYWVDVGSNGRPSIMCFCWVLKSPHSKSGTWWRLYHAPENKDKGKWQLIIDIWHHIRCYALTIHRHFLPKISSIKNIMK